MADGFCALAPIKASVNQRAGLEKEGSCCVDATGTRDPDGDRRRLARLTVPVQDFNQRTLGKLTVAQ
jgi:hypothetical protein